MQFKPKTEEELDKEGLLPKGVYPFEVLNAEDKKSKRTGADMIELELRVFGDGGAENTVKDWLVSSYLRKLFNFARVTGTTAAYHAGRFSAADCRNRQGWAEIDVELGKQKPDAPDGECYPAKNVVKNYVFEPTGNGGGKAATPPPQRGLTDRQAANLESPPPKAGAKPASSLDEDVPF